MPYVIALLVLALVLAWGGFYGLATCAVGLVACALGAYRWLNASWRAQPLPAAPLLFLGVALVYMLSSLVSGITLTTVSETGTWFVVAGMSFLVASLDDAEYETLLTAVGWVGVATSLAGMLVYTDIIPLSSGMLGARLQFTFQYANAAAAWYGACAFLCLLSPAEHMRACALLPATALLLTESGGGILCFVLVALCVGATSARLGEWGKVLSALVQVIAAVGLYALLRISPGAATSAVALVPAAGLCVAFLRWERRLSGFARAKQACVLCSGLLALLAVVAVVALSGRAQEALYTFAERLYQMRDGISLWLTSPILGVGPDNWQYLYPYHQTAWYHTTVVHSSYVQMLVDAGPLAVAFLVAAMAVCLGESRTEEHSPWRSARLCAIALLMLHAAIDFDLQFGSLAALLVLLVAGGGAANIRITHTSAKGFWGGVLCLALCLPASFMGFRCGSISSTLSAANATGRHETCIELFEASRWAHGDQGALDEYLAALYAKGDYNQVARAYEGVHHPSDDCALYASMSYYALGDSEKGGLVLIEHMEAQPYNDQFFRNAKTVVDAYGLSRQLASRYNAAVDAANALISRANALQQQREYLDTYV